MGDRSADGGGDFNDRLQRGGRVGEGLAAAGRDVPLEGDPPPEDGGGKDGWRRRLEEDLRECPVKPLGKRGHLYFYLQPSGELHELAGREHSEAGIDSLFEGKTGWLFDRFPRHGRPDERGGEAPVIGWQIKAARPWLLRACSLRGLFDPDRMLRGPGAWRGPDGALILHCGDKLYIYRAGSPVERVPAGVTIGGRVYAAAAPQGEPAAEPASAADAAALHALLGRWNFRAPHEASRVLLGWIGQAFLCGVNAWRAHIWLTGSSSTGKTTLQDFVFGLLGDVLLPVSDPSAAGLRNALAGAARPVAIDEIEQSEHNRRAAEVVELARLASTDKQGGVVRADTNRAGGVKHYSVRAACYFSSILHPPFRPQDLSRITVIDLAPLPPDPDAAARLALDAAAMVRLGPALRERLAQAFVAGRLQHNLAVYDAALQGRGFSARMADQFGTLLAYADTLLTDHPADPDQVAAFLDVFDTAEFETHGEGDDHDLCLNKLLSAPAPHWEQGQRATVAQLLDGMLSGQGGLRVRDTLLALGLRVVAVDQVAGWLAVANHHDGLEAVFQGSRWAWGVWSQALRRVPGARMTKAGMRFGGPLSRAVLLPPESWRFDPAQGVTGEDGVTAV